MIPSYVVAILKLQLGHTSIQTAIGTYVPHWWSFILFQQSQPRQFELAFFQPSGVPPELVPRWPQFVCLLVSSFAFLLFCKIHRSGKHDSSFFLDLREARGSNPVKTPGLYEFGSRIRCVESV